MMTPEQMAQAAALFPGMGPLATSAPMPRSHEMSRTVPAYGGIDALRNTLGPMLAESWGMPSPHTLPRPAPGQGIGEAWYAERVAARQWEQVKQEAMFNMAKGLGNDAGAMVKTLGGAAALGLDKNQFAQAIADQGRNPSYSSRQIAGMLMSTDMLGANSLRGGHPMATYETMFANRALFGQPRGVIVSPFDRERQAWNTQVSTDMSHMITQAVRGNELNAAGVMPRFGFTRGFQDEDISRIAVEAGASGRWGDLGGRLVKHARAGNTAGYTRTMDEVGRDLGEGNKMFEALGDVIGSRDMNQLMQSMNQLTHGKWQKMDWTQVRSSLRDIEATAQTLGIAKEDMFNTVTEIQRTMQGAIGISASHVRMGMTGGGYASAGAANYMTQSVYGTAQATGANSPADIARIKDQQQGLMAIGLNSQAGRAASLVAYMHQEGLVSNKEFDAYERTMKTGTMAERKAATDRLTSTYFGTAEEGERLYNNDSFMRDIRNRTLSPAAGRVMGMVESGQSAEFAERGDTARRELMSKIIHGHGAAAGLTDMASPGQVAAARVGGILGYLGAAGQGAGVKYLQGEYSRTLAKSGPEAAAQAVISGLQSNTVLSGYAAGAIAAGDKRALLVEGAGLAQRGGAASEASAVLHAVQGFGTGNMNAEQRREYARIQKLVNTDPAAAAAAANKFYQTPGMLTPEQQALVQKELGMTRGQAAERNAARSRLMASSTKGGLLATAAGAGTVSTDIGLGTEMTGAIAERDIGRAAAGEARAIAWQARGHNQAAADNRPELRENILQTAAGVAMGTRTKAELANVEAGQAQFQASNIGKSISENAGKAGAGGAPMTLTGILQMVDAEGHPMYNVNLNAQGK